MKTQVEQIAKMSHTLESAGFNRPQSNAVIESVALAMETFAVTPEILDERIDGLRQEMNAQFAAQGEEIKDLRKSVNRLEQNILEIQRSMLEFQQTMAGFQQDMVGFQQDMVGFQQDMLGFQRGTIRYMLAFLVLMLGAVVGMFGAMFSQIFVP